MSDHTDAKERPEPRNLDVIFDDIRALMQSDGALHEISSLFYRDWVIAINIPEKKVADDPNHRWSPTRLNNNEFMLLMGLMVQSVSEKTYSVIAENSDFETKVDTFLREFHDRLLVDARPGAEGFSYVPGRLGTLAREAIYYGADSFYLHQLERFARERYRADFEWLIRNGGLSVRPMVEIAHFIAQQVSRQISAVGTMKKLGNTVTKEEMTNSLLVSKSEISKKFGTSKAAAFTAKFSTKITDSNSTFTNAFVVNQVNLAPLVDLGEYLYAANSYRLFESIYESPFYWMLADESYRETAARHRGAFVERTAANVLRSVFGKENVFENITIHTNKKRIAGEADVLVVYGEFLIIVQAKSKRVTLKARSGEEEALEKDFEGAIQAPYRQASEFADILQAGAECRTKDGKILTLHSAARTFPLVVLGDAFPAATFLSQFLLKRGDTIAPVIWDLGVLDCVARVLPTPTEFLYYLKCRSDTFDKIHSDSEYNFLGYHLKNKLAMNSEYDYMMLERDFATPVDNFMAPHDVGVHPDRPVGIWGFLDITLMSNIFNSLRSAQPILASSLMDLYGLSYSSLASISVTMERTRAEVIAGKNLNAFSFAAEDGGFTYVACRNLTQRNREIAEEIGSKYKYDQKCDRWCVIVDCIETSMPVDMLLPLYSKWQEEPERAARSRKVDEIYKTIELPRVNPIGFTIPSTH